MIALACVLAVAAWLWWTGLEVPARNEIAVGLWVAGTVVLFLEFLRSGRRLPAASRLLRALLWTLALGGVAAIVAPASQPLLDWLGPLASYAVAPAWIPGWISNLLGLEARALPGAVVFQELSTTPQHSTSWQQFGLLAALASVATFALFTAPRRRAWARGVAVCAAVVAVWLPFRFVLVSRLAADLDWLGAFWNPLAVAASFLPALWLAGRIRPIRSLSRMRWTPRAAALPLAAIAIGAALLSLGLLADPVGERGEGRLLIDDAHSDWEWTTDPFNREVYGRRTTYNYAVWVDSLSHYYSIDTNVDRELTAELLAGYDVLILKTPTRPYLTEERDAIVRFVSDGGGLLLISDHTNLFGMTTFLNPIAKPFGLEFDVDDTYELVSGAPSTFEPPRLGAHSAVVHMPKMRFETSCSLKPGFRSRPVITGRGLGSEPVDYSHQNFFGNIQPDPEERWGAFLQAASSRHGRGRVVAFTDSTVFSNFSVFFRGKPELGLGLIEYLDREPSPWTIPLRLGAAAGLLLIAFPFVWVRLREKAQLRPARPLGAAAVLVLTVVAVGWIAGAAAATSVNAASLRLPVPREPMTTVVFDREHSAYRLPTLIETNPVQPERCFDAFYTATQRIHLFPRIAEQLATDAESAQAVVFLNPESTPAPEEFERLYAWVRGGGRLLIMEPMRGTHVAANRLLEPAGLRISASFPGQGAEIPAVSGYSIYGAPSFLLGEAAVGDSATPQPIVAAADLGSGRVAVVLGSESFSLQTMGPSFNNPTPRQQAIYDRVYRLFEEILFDDEAWGQECRLAGFVRRQDATPAGRSGR